jgi:ATP-dependent DNA helicase RecG
VTKVQEILEPIARPLDFATRNDCSALGALKDIERTLKPPLLIAMEPADPGEKQQIEIMIGLVSGIDAAALEEKKLRLGRFLKIYARLSSGEAAEEHGKPAGPTTGGADLRSKAPELTPDTPVKYVKGVGPVVAEKLAAHGIHTVADALRFYPRAYEDRRNLKTIGELREKETATVLGTIVARGQAGRRAWEMVIKDDSGYLSLKWFHYNRNFLERLKDGFSSGDPVVVTGKTSFYRERPQIVHPEIRKAEAFEEDDLNYRRIIPIYPRIEGISEGHFLRIMQRVVEGASGRTVETIPTTVRSGRMLLGAAQAVREIHFPPDDSEMEGLETTRSAPRRRLAYEEYFFLQLGLALRKSRSESVPGIAFSVEGDAAELLRGIVPFELTAAQKRVIREIAADMARPSPMNRLLQGDVGSGKTAVAFAAMIAAVKNGFQSAMLAPTEILAAQHLGSISRYAEGARLAGLNLRVALLTASTKSSERTEILRRAAGGDLDIVVGTHAVLEDRVEFKSLGLAVIDEQHRFGVMQRAAIRRKGRSPDVLVMTATPIPRTLALSLYGDLDLSVIDELPPGRTPILTKVFFDGQQQKCFDMMEREIRSGRQCYVVYPLVEESEKSDLKDATRMSEEFRTRIFPHRRIGLLHGRMRDDEKSAVMSQFKSGTLDILVSTTVIEVGVDVPNASVMVVEHAERFGLSQLHQLRGRVGRGAARSYCLLVARYNRSEDAERRLRMMEKTSDGFAIAEEDLDIRGPGEFTGVRQSGLPDLMMTGLRLDSQLLSIAREDAFALVRRDPGLSKPENRGIREQVARAWADKLDLSSVG